MAEPAANVVFVSPKQIAAGSDLFERYVIAADRQIKTLLTHHGAELIFHCCGELNDYMLRQFCTLEPVILSLGSSRKLWEDAAIVPKDIVLYGNLPSKHFYSDAVVTVEQVEAQACDLLSLDGTDWAPIYFGQRTKASAFFRIVSPFPGTLRMSHSLPRMNGCPACAIRDRRSQACASTCSHRDHGVRVEVLGGQIPEEHDVLRDDGGVLPELPRAAQAEDHRLQRGELAQHVVVQLAAAVEDQLRPVLGQQGLDLPIRGDHVPLEQIRPRRDLLGRDVDDIGRRLGHEDRLCARPGSARRPSGE